MLHILPAATTAQSTVPQIMSTTTMRTGDNREIIVPNGDLVSKEVTNWTGTDEIRRLEVLVGVAYGSDPAEVERLLGEG